MRVVEFGRWNGESIKWDFVSDKGGKITLISKIIVAKCSFDNATTYLNYDFLQRAFSEEERSYIKCCITLPDRTLIMKHYTSTIERICDSCWYWLYDGSCIYSDGCPSYLGQPYGSRLGVRPTILFYMTEDQFDILENKLKIESALSKDQFLFAKELKENFTTKDQDQWYKKRLMYHRKRQCLSKMENLCSQYLFDDAYEFYCYEANQFVELEMFESVIKKWKEKYHDNISEKILEAFHSYKFEDAESIYRKNQDCVDKTWYEEQCKISMFNFSKINIEKLLSNYQFEEVRKYYESEAYKYLEQEIFEEILMKAKTKYINLKRKKISSDLEKFNFISAEKKFHECTIPLDEIWFKEVYDKAKQKYNEVIRQEIELICDFLKIFNYDGAKTYYESLEEAIRKEIKFQILVDKYKKFENCLAIYDFLQADRLCEELGIQDYENLKLPYVKKWFAEEVTEGEDEKPYILDDEQTMAVLNTNKNTIVAARAGSGKTRTLVAKIIYLVAKYNVKPEEFLVFVFNKVAAKEVNERLAKIKCNGKCLFTNVKIATTFHAFARKIVYDISNEHYGEILANNDRDHFIQVITHMIPQDVVYRFFRDEVYQISKEKFRNEEEFYDSVRRSRYNTLDGKRVKSYAEKIIADYLFEHGIKYYYEHPLYLSSANKICKAEDRKNLWYLNNAFGEMSIKPDFYLVDYCIPWEHWAITGTEDVDKIEKINKAKVIGAYNNYRDKMEWKRWFFSKQWINNACLTKTDRYCRDILNLRGLIETTKCSKMNRQQFEAYIEKKLSEHNIHAVKLPEEQLVQSVWERQIKKFTKMIIQFIDRTQQQFYENPVVLYDMIKECEKRKKLEDCNEVKEFEQIVTFWKLGWTSYVRYLDYLTGKKSKDELSVEIARSGSIAKLEFDKYGTDFNILMKRAVELLKRHDKTEIILLLSAVKYVFIDEYQDFSNLFLALVKEVRNICPDSKLFVVGDDWQAINRFAGADTKYFDDFGKEFFEDYKKLEISTNYRSALNIVNNAKNFVHIAMHNENNYSAFRQDSGNVKVVQISENDYFDNSTLEGGICFYALKRRSNEPRRKKLLYIRNVARLIKDNFRRNKIMILHRNNDTSFAKYGNISIDDFLSIVREVCWRLYGIDTELFDSKVEIRTIHRAKGLEADVVILLEADDSVIPSNINGYRYYELFGDTPEILMDEQKKLFYVALTRAKEVLYIFHDAQPETGSDGFLQGLCLPILSMDSKEYVVNADLPTKEELPDDFFD